MTLDRDDFEAIRVIVRDEVSRAVTRALRSLRSPTIGAPIPTYQPEGERGEPGALMSLEEAEEDGRRLVDEVAARLLAKARRAPPKKRRPR